MKKFLVPVAAALFGLAGVQHASAQDAVAMSFGGSTIELWNDIIVQMKPVIEKEGYRLLTHDPQFRVEQQAQDWRTWIAQGDVKAIMGWPINADALIPVTRQAQEAGIPVIGYAAKWDGASAAMLTTPEQDGRDIAKYAVEWIKEKHGADATVKVAILSDEQNDLTRYRVEGLEKEVSESLPSAQIVKLPSISREEGYNAARQQLTAHPDTTVWLSYSNENLKGAYKALLDSGVAADDANVFMASMDVINEDLDMIKQRGIYRMAFAFRSKTLAEANTKLLLAGARGETLEDIYVRPELVTPETADDFYVGR